MKIKNIYLTLLATIVMLSSCGAVEKTEEKEKVQNRIATGTVLNHGKEVPIKYGGLFRMNESSSFKTLFPHNVGDVVSVHIASQIYEGLVKFNSKTLEVEPCIAKSFTPNEDASVWTFKLNENVFFHDDDCFEGGKGRQVKATDIKYCLDMLGTAYPQNTNFYVLQNKVLGVNEHYKATGEGDKVDGGVKGIKVIDDFTIEISLYNSLSFFPKLMAHNSCWIFPKEAFEKYGEEMRTHTVGTGPFLVQAIKEGNQVRLKRNPNYWRKDKFGNQLPYLDLVKITFTKDKKSELSNFKKDNLDMIAKLPVDEMEAVLVGLDEAVKGNNTPFDYQQTSALEILNYDFSHNKEVFKDVRVRKAFCYAINRQSIIQYTLRGEGEPAVHGIVPNFSNYDNSVIKGFTYNPEKARKLLAEAGYPNGENFPKVTLTLSEGGGRNSRIAEEVYSMLKKNLGIHIDVDIIPFTTILEKMNGGSLTFYRRGWVADYPDASTFLEMYYGKSVPKDSLEPSMINTSRYQNPEFDAIFEKAMKAPDEEKRMKFYQQCEQILIDDAATLPIFYSDYVRLVKSNVIGFPINSMDYRDLSIVFLSSKK